MDHVRLNQAIADFAILTFENQDALVGLVGSQPWQVDLTTSRLELGPNPFRIVLLGSHSEETNTWLWSWANQHLGLGPDHPSIAPAHALRQRAQQLGMPELDSVEAFDISGVNDLGWLPAAGIASVAGHLIGATGLYSGPYPGGRVWLAIMDAPAARTNPIKLPRMSSMAWQAAAGSPTAAADGVRHRNALELWAHRRGLGQEALPDGGLGITWPAGSRADVTFDELGREVNLKMTIQPADVPPRLPHEQDQPQG